MKYEDSIKKILVGLIILIALSLVVTMVVGVLINNTPQTNVASETEKPNLNKIIIPSETLPSALPADLPFEKNANVIQNYTIKAKDGTEQSLVVMKLLKL